MAEQLLHMLSLVDNRRTLKVVAIGCELLTRLIDGGGIRGLAELRILHHIMVGVQQRLKLLVTPKPCEYFYLTAGTSTGGLVAIMLIRLQLSTTEAIEQYNIVAKKIFGAGNKKFSLFSIGGTFKATTLATIAAASADKLSLWSFPQGSELMDQRTTIAMVIFLR